LTTIVQLHYTTPMDDIQKMLHHAGKVLAKMLTGKEIKDEFASVVELLNAEDIIAIAEGLLQEKRFSECEDFMYFSIERNYSAELYNLGTHLAERVVAMDSELLEQNNYSTQEAKAWLKDWDEYKP